MAKALDYNVTGNARVDAINKARAENVARGRRADSGAGDRSLLRKPEPAPTTITSASVAPSAPLVPVAPATPTLADGLQGTIESRAQQYGLSVAPGLEQDKAALDKARNDLTGALTNRKGKTALEDESYSEAVDPAKRAYDEIGQELIAEQTSARRRIEAIEKNPRGASAEGIAQEVRAVQRDTTARQADLSVIQLARQNDYFGAKEIADRKVAALLEDEANRIQALQLTYNDNKELFTLKEQRQFESQQAERTRLLTERSAALTKVGDLAIEALRNGAPTSVVSAMQKAQTPEEATSIGGTYIGKLDRELAAANLANVHSQIAARNAEAALAAQGGSVDGVVANNTAMAGLTADQKNTAVLTSLLKGEIGQGTRTNLANVLGVVAAAQDLAAQRPDGNFVGISPLNKFIDGIPLPFTEAKLPIIPFRNTFMRQESTENRQYLEAINLKVQQWASGAALTDKQTDQVEKFTPRAGDRDATVKTKLNGLVNFMLTQSAAQLQSEGITYVPEKVNLFEAAELLEEASPEQKEALRAAGLIE